MFHRLYCVPTHRPIEPECLRQFCEEVRSVGEPSTAFLLLDDLDNGINLRSLVAAGPPENTFYVPRAVLLTLYHQVLECLPREHHECFRDCWPAGGTNYGITMNKLSLLAQILQASYVHRRDSDVLVRLKSSGRVCYPAEVEREGFRRTVNGMAPQVVGGTYSGKWSIDVDLLTSDDDGVRTLLDCLSIPEESQHEFLEQARQEVSDGRQPELITANAVPDAGSIAFGSAIRLLPCSTSPLTGGTDYFPAKVLRECGQPVLSHNMRVEHRHAPGRYDTDTKLRNYLVVVSKLIDYLSVYRPFYHQLRQFSFDAIPTTQLSAQIADILGNRLDQAAKDLPIRKEKLGMFEGLLKSARDRRLPRLAHDLKKQMVDIPADMNRATAAHVQLLRSWPFILDAVLQGDGNTLKQTLDDARVTRTVP